MHHAHSSRTTGGLIQRTPLPPGAIAAALAVFLAGGLGPNLDLALVSVVVLLVGTALLWRPTESPVLLFTFAFPWLQASIAIFHANWLDINLIDLAPFRGDMRTAVLLTLCGLLTVALGMRLGAGPWRWQDASDQRKQACAHPVQRWLRLYFMAYAASLIAITFAWVVPGLSQPMLALAALKWAFYYMLAYAAFARGPESKRVLVLVFLLELATGVGGYFSDFRTVFFVTIFAAVSARVQFSPRALVGVSTLGAILLCFAVIWTTVKVEFRNFLSGGATAQIVTVDYTRRIGKLAELVGELDAEKLSSGMNDLLRRLTYVEFFGAVLDYVPAQVPHENGAILWDAVSRLLLPRLFFPDKPIIDDSVRTNHYTGLGVAGAEQGTSISLGWIAESYIDFGSLGMFPAILLIGVFYGRVYRHFLRWSPTRGLLGMGLASAILIGAGPLDNSFTKTFGGLVVCLLVAWTLVKFSAPRLAPWLLASRTR